VGEVDSRPLRGRAAGGVRIRPVRAGDLRAVVAIERQAFPDDPWTLDTAGGRLSRSALGGHARGAVWLARLIRLAWLTEAVLFARLACAVLLRWPATRRYIVAEADGAVAGYACLNTATAPSGEVQAIAVSGGREGRGIGRALLADLIAAAARLGCRDVVLCVRAGNNRARDLYLRNGFTEAGLRRGYYQPSGTDALVMRLPLVGRPPADGVLSPVHLKPGARLVADAVILLRASLLRRRSR
jgi:ribosomal protein S18 acetylase RimI-like enzyme